MRHVKALRWAVFSLLCGGTMMSVSCGDVIISSVKTGLFSFITGGVVTLGSGQIGALLGGLTNTNNAMDTTTGN